MDWGATARQVWQSETVWYAAAPACAALFVLVLLIALARANRSVANMTLALIAVSSIATAVFLGMRGQNSARTADGDLRTGASQAMLPALACLDGLAGEGVEAACEKVLFASPDTIAAAVSYTAAQIARLTSARGSPAGAPDVKLLRRTIERDRYGLAAHVLATRDGCTPTDCGVFAALSERTQLVANLNEKLYQSLVGRHALSWSQPTALTGATSVAAVPAVLPSGKPTSADFPTAASIPPVNIMTPEPALAPAARSAPAAANAQAAPPRAPAATTPKKAAVTRPKPSAPVALSPEAEPAE